MKRLIYIILVLPFLLPACGEKINYEYQIQQWIKAHNEHNVTKELTFYPDDAVIIFPSDTIKGTTALRNLFEYDSVMNNVLTAKDLLIHHDTVIINSFTDQFDFGRLSGINELHSLPGMKMIFRNGLIQTTETTKITQEDQKNLDQLISDIALWMQDKYPYASQEFIETHKLSRHTTETALMHMKILKEYLSSKSNK